MLSSARLADDGGTRLGVQNSLAAESAGVGGGEDAPKPNFNSFQHQTLQNLPNELGRRNSAHISSIQGRSFKIRVIRPGCLVFSPVNKCCPFQSLSHFHSTTPLPEFQSIPTYRQIIPTDKISGIMDRDSCSGTSNAGKDSRLRLLPNDTLALPFGIVQLGLSDLN